MAVKAKSFKPDGYRLISKTYEKLPLKQVKKWLQL